MAGLYYVNGRPRTETLGTFPQVSVGGKPTAGPPVRSDQGEREGCGRHVEQVAQDFVTSYVDVDELRSKDEIVRILTKYLYPRWANRKFIDIGRADVATLRDEIMKANGKRQTSMVLAILSKLTNWFAANRSDTYASPIVRGMSFKQQSRDRILNDDGSRAVWHACEGTFGDMMKLLLLTAQRRERVGSMKWDELKDGVWTLPHAPREKTNPGSLKLPQLALDILDKRDRLAGNPFVFPGRIIGHAFANYAKGKADLDAKLHRREALGAPRSAQDGTLADVSRWRDTSRS